MAKRILIAEDDQMSRELLRLNCELRGYDVVAVEDGYELLKAMEQQPFDLIITDLMMATLDGFSATEILKIHDTVTPVIALTSLSNDKIAHIMGTFVEIFHKPCNYNELLNRVDHLIES